MNKRKNEIEITQRLFFDFEVYPNWWCVVFRDFTTSREFVVTSDNKSNLLKNIKRNTLLIGFNIKMYDMVVLNAIVKGATPQEVYKISKEIIDENGKRKLSDESRDYYNNFSFQDLMDDWGAGSLKKFESNFGLSVEECPIPFAKQNLTKENKNEIIEYCRHDVYATIMLYKNRQDYIDSKKVISKAFNIPLDVAYKQSHPKLACTILECRKTKPTMNEKLKFPKNMYDYCVEHIGKRIVKRVMNLRPKGEYFPAELFTETWFENRIMFGDGGLHSVLCPNIHAVTNDEYLIVDYDVTSYYPSLMTKGKLLTRTTTKGYKFQEMLDMRLAIKSKKKDNPRLEDFDNALKLVINGLYGAMGNKNLSAYDPCMRSSICRVGQLMLVALCHRIHKECDAEILKTNTDGILIYIARSKKDDMENIIKDWETNSGLKMKPTYIEEVWQKNVSNYIQVLNRKIDPKDGLKLHGSWVAQAYSKRERRNPLCAPICQKAVVEKLVYKKPIKTTILNTEEDLLEYCYTVSRGRTFDEMFQETDDDYIELQKYNRIIATKDIKGGEIYKYNASFNGMERKVKVSGIPTFCAIINEDIRKKKAQDEPELWYEWYIETAKEMLDVEWLELS